MKIALFGASGNIGKRIGAEALERGHELTALTRHRSRCENNRMHSISADYYDQPTWPSHLGMMRWCMPSAR